MALSRNDSCILSELQRAAFEKWKSSKNYMEVQQETYPAYNLGGDFDGHVDVTFNIREDGDVAVLLNVSERQEPLNDIQLQDALDMTEDMPTSPCQPQNLLNNFFEDANEGWLEDDADLTRPQKLYLYFLELQQLKAIKDIEPTLGSKCGSPKTPYDGGLSELQRAAFEKWSKDGKTDQIATKKFASLNLEDDSMQPTMSTLKGDADSVLRLEPLLNNVGFQI